MKHALTEYSIRPETMSIPRASAPSRNGALAARQIVGSSAHFATAPPRSCSSRSTSSRGWQTGNVLNYLPRSCQAEAKQGLHEIWMAETSAKAERAFDEWIERCDDKYPTATTCLACDRDELLVFYDFLAAHWTHLRTTNVIESAFATIRHRSSRAKGCGTRQTMLSIDLQDGPVRGEILAPTPRFPPAREGHRGSQDQRRH